MMRSLAAIIAGFLAYVSLMGITGWVLGVFFAATFGLGVPHHGAALAVEMAYSIMYAALGGYITAALAPTDPITYAGMLAAIILALGALNILITPAGMRPIPFEAATIILTSIVTVLGGVWYSRQVRVITA
jgi:hypothetical protein